MTHSVMFHHFHNETHLPAQGSLSSDDFKDMLAWLGKKYSLLNADEYAKKFSSGPLNESDICLSFDDALKCQYDIAIPILQEFGLNAFFFVYSSAFSDSPDF
jgi:peptidoglycan/xylan/chitin deacetylase (PgdA/CDA1 family)